MRKLKGVRRKVARRASLEFYSARSRTSAWDDAQRLRLAKMWEYTQGAKVRIMGKKGLIGGGW